MSARSTPESREEGFVLPMTLVVVAIIGLSLWAAMSVLDGMRRDLTTLTQGLRLETAAQRAEARVLYAVLSEPPGPLGVRVNGLRVSREEEFGAPSGEGFDESFADGEERLAETWMRFDGQPYRLPAPTPADMTVVVSIQDDAGLFDLNSINELVISRYLQALGVAEQDTRKLAGALADYIDRDDLRRLNGAEAPEYRQAGLPPPANAPLRESAEVWNVMGWKDGLSLDLRRRVGQTATAALMFPLSNMNTASREALMAWFDLTREQAGDVIAARRLQPLLGTHEITRITGVNPEIDELRVYTFPSRRFRLRVWPESGALSSKTWETWLTRAEFSADRPYYRGRSALLDFSPPGLGGRPDDQRESDGELENLPQTGRLSAQ